MRLHASLVLVVALVGCSASTRDPEPSAVPRFKSADLAGNSTAFASLVDQLCLKNGADRERFARAIKATNWEFEHTQTLDPDNPYSVDVWKAPEAQVIHGKLAGDEILVCNVAIAEGIADKSKVSRALSGLAGRPRMDSEWRWRSGADEFVMDFSEGPDAATKFQVNVEIWRLPWWRRLLG